MYNGKLPQHIAFIMDGNGRWATSRLLPRSVGHKQGLKRAEKVINYTKELGIKYLTLYVFSTENWKRPQSEIDTLFSLAEQYISQFEKFCKDSIRVIFSGDEKGLPSGLVKKMHEVRKATENNSALTVNLCINYGSRNEIVRAVNYLKDNNFEITEDSIEKQLCQGLPVVDLIVRTGGQTRLSNFLLYESAYAELYFTDTLWPDFNNKKYDLALKYFAKRVRNYGGLVTDNDK